MKSSRWNGITIKKQKTIENYVKSYSILLYGLGLSIGICMFLTVWVYLQNYNKVINSIYSLQEIEDGINEMQDQSLKYILTGAEEQQSAYQQAKESILPYYDQLSSLSVAGNYHRNLSDFRQLMSHYERKLEGLTLTVDTEEEDSRYFSLSDIQRAVLNKHRVLADEVQEYFRQQRSVLGLRLKTLLYLFLLFFITGFFLIWQSTSILASHIVHPLLMLTEYVRNAWKHPDGSSASQGKMTADPQTCSAADAPAAEAVPIARAEISQKSLLPAPEEIQVLQNSFQEMLLRIQAQIAELKETMAVKEQLKEQEIENLRIANLLTVSELHCLQMQMNPHFLFNTLNMIQQTVYLDQKEKTSFLLKETASFLRYSLDYIGKEVTVGKELEALGCYVSLQEERFGNRIFFEFILDERLNRWYIPCLILQPLVENSILHGLFQSRSDAQITIRTRFDEETGNGFISIEDNGVGMSAEKLESIRAGLQETAAETEHRIGLHNVARRLCFFQRGKEELQIDSQENMGTTVTIWLYAQAEEKVDEGSDRG